MIGIYEVTTVQAVNKSLRITKSINERQTQCTFSTLDDVNEWEEIFIENEYQQKLFAGIVETPEIDESADLGIRRITVKGYVKMFDRLTVNQDYEDTLAGDIVRGTITDDTAGFTANNVQDGITIKKALFNFTLPSNVMRRLANVSNYDWFIDHYKDVHFFPHEDTTSNWPITDSTNHHRKLKIKPITTNFFNEIVVRGGTYLSSTQTFETFGDGVLTQFLLPERPHDVTVFVSLAGGAYVEKTIQTKFGEETITADFAVNFNEKYIENGVHAVLGATDKIKVTFKYDVPLRIKRRNQVSVDAMKALFPDLAPDGVFQRIYEDPDLDERDDAYELADTQLTLYSNLQIEAGFETDDDLYNKGELLPITRDAFSGNTIIQKVVSRHLGGTQWKHSISCNTVLYDFEDFLRDLKEKSKPSVIDGEIVETIQNNNDDFTLADVITATVDQNQQSDDVTFADTDYQALNQSVTYVLGHYWPSSFTDPKRVFLLDSSPLG